VKFTFIRSSFVFLFVSILLATACARDKKTIESVFTNNTPGDSNPDDDCPLLTDADPPVITEQSVYLNPLNFLMINVILKIDRDVTVHIEYSSDNEVFFRTPTETFSRGTTAEIIVMGLTPDTQYYIRAVVTGSNYSSTIGETEIVTTGSWPDDWPTPIAYDLSNGSGWTDLGWTEQEVFCFNQMLRATGSELYMCTNRLGIPVWYFDQFGVYQLLMVKPMSNHRFVANFNAIAVFSTNESKFYKYFTLDWFNDRSQNHIYSIHHDVIQITEGPWKGAIAFLTNSSDEIIFEPPPPGQSIDITDNLFLNDYFANISETATATYITDGIIVFDYESEEILWEWSLHGELGDNKSVDPRMLPYTRSSLGGGGPWNGKHDWTHSNAILHGIDEDGDFFWISLRHQDWIIKIDVLTGKIAWRFGYLGDFELVENIDDPLSPKVSDLLWMYHQHAPEWLSHSNGKYEFVLFDNGNLRHDPYANSNVAIWTDLYSRIVGFKLDENSMKAAITFDYGSQDQANPNYFYAQGVGDADMMPNGQSLLMTKGWWTEDVNDDVYLAEISYPEGELLWKLLSAHPSGFKDLIYRGSYFPSIYDTTWWYRVER
jgi:arylsulfotransferase ASST